MSQANLSETLFKPRFKHPETSTRFVGSMPVRSRRCNPRWTVKTFPTGIV